MAEPIATVQNHSSIQMQDFMQLLLTQLTYQDPMKPMDNQQFLAQMAQFTNLQQTQQISENTAQMLSTDLSTQSINLLGKQVTVLNEDGTSTPGSVSGITFNKGAPLLTVTPTAGGTPLPNVPLSQIATIAQ
jgi:flagellar basal-body rod modification protein FlgD